MTKNESILSLFKCADNDPVHSFQILGANRSNSEMRNYSGEIYLHTLHLMQFVFHGANDSGYNRFVNDILQDSANEDTFSDTDLEGRFAE